MMGDETRRRLAKAREMRARPTHRLACPEGHAVVTLYASGIVEGWCRCGRKLRPLALDEAIGEDGRTVRRG